MPASPLALVVLALVLTEIFVVVLLVAMFRMYKRYELLDAELKQTKARAEAESKAQFEQAQSQANLLIDEARQKALKIVSDTEGFSQQGTQRMREALEWMLQSQMRTYTEELKKARGEAENRMAGLADEINEMTRTELQVFSHSLAEQTAKAQQEAHMLVKQAYAKMHEEVETYKKHRMEQVDEMTRSIVLRVAREVLGKSLNQADHEALVLQALGKVKGREAEVLNTRVNQADISEAEVEAKKPDEVNTSGNMYTDQEVDQRQEAYATS